MIYSRTNWVLCVCSTRSAAPLLRTCSDTVAINKLLFEWRSLIVMWPRGSEYAADIITTLDKYNIFKLKLILCSSYCNLLMVPKRRPLDLDTLWFRKVPSEVRQKKKKKKRDIPTHWSLTGGLSVSSRSWCSSSLLNKVESLCQPLVPAPCIWTTTHTHTGSKVNIGKHLGEFLRVRRTMVPSQRSLMILWPWYRPL